MLSLRDTENMNEYEVKLKRYLAKHQIEAEHLSFQQSCHSVAEAALASGASAEDFVKSICMIDGQGRLIVAIVKGEDRASTSRVAKALAIERPRIATPEEILDKTGYLCGGTPSFGYPAIFLVDPRVMEKTIIYTGGGSQSSLTTITPQEMLRANQGRVVRVRR